MYFIIFPVVAEIVWCDPTDVASNVVAMDLRLDVQIACDGLQPKFQCAEYFTVTPLISQPVFI